MNTARANIGNTVNHPPRPKHHPWKRGAGLRMANGKRISEAKQARDMTAQHGKRLSAKGEA